MPEKERVIIIMAGRVAWSGRARQVIDHAQLIVSFWSSSLIEVVPKSNAFVWSIPPSGGR